MDTWLFLFYHVLHRRLEYGWRCVPEFSVWSSSIITKEVHKCTGNWNQLLWDIIFSLDDHFHRNISWTQSCRNILLFNSFSVPPHLIRHILAPLLKRKFYPLMPSLIQYLNPVLRSQTFYMHYNQIHEEQQSNDPKRTFRERLILYKEVFLECWLQCLNTFLVFFVSLSLFPAVSAQISSVDGIFGPNYFAPITTFLTFNLFAVLGNLCANDKFFTPGNLWIPISVRFVFIPLFLFCNYREGARRAPVLIKSDWLFWLLSTLLGFTSGYFSSLSLMFAPRIVKPQNAQVAGMMAGSAVIVGIFAGVCITFLWPVFIE